MANQRQPTRERRRQIAEAALDILGKHGVKSLTAAELGKAVGIADATVFRHFKNKQEIVLAAIEHLEEQLFEGFPPTDEDPVARLRSLFRGRMEILRRRPELLQVAMNDRLLELAGKAGLERLIHCAERTRLFVVECLAEARVRGLIPSSLQPEPLSFVVLGALHTAAFTFSCHKAACGVSPEAVWGALETLLRSAGTPAAERKAS